MEIFNELYQPFEIPKVIAAATTLTTIPFQITKNEKKPRLNIQETQNNTNNQTIETKKTAKTKTKKRILNTIFKMKLLNFV